VEAEAEIAATVVGAGVKVDVVVGEEGGARLRPQGNEDVMEERGEPLCFHETIIKINDTPVLRYFLEYWACGTFADEPFV
jgi:hypothetical protein